MKTLTSSQMGKENRFSEKAIRIYEQKGLSKPDYVDEKTGWRHYSIEQSTKLDLILELQQIGFTLDEIVEATEQGDVASVITTDPDGDHMFMRSPTENFTTEDAWIIYEINGEPLTLMDGWPCRSWFPEHGISMGTRNFNEIIVTDQPVRIDEGASVLNGAGGPGSWIGDPDNPEAQFANKPNVGVLYGGEAR